jgi:hypothetical protein
VTLDELARDLRENERVTALQGQTLGIVVEDLKKHADKETLEKLDDLTRNRLVPDVAALQARMDSASPLDKVLGFLERLTGRPGFRFTLVILLVLGSGVLLNSCSDRMLDIAEKMLTAQERTQEATQETATTLEEMAEPPPVADPENGPE